MALLIGARSIAEAWREGVLALLGSTGTELHNLILSISSPAATDEPIVFATDPRVFHPKGENPRDVANKIFPGRTWMNSVSREDFYARYEKAHRRGRKKSWGTYFQRLTSFGQLRVNQLERSIEVINGWQKSPGTAIVFHLTSPETDRPRPLGGPCLQTFQLFVVGDTISGTAYYRNHDYFNKALPNLLSLYQLLSYISQHSNRKVGNLVCHSGHAYSSQGKSALRKLLAAHEEAQKANG
jgi:thymidylate synthase